MARIAEDLRGTWDTWRGMQQRCYNPKHNSFEHYGARGIRIYFDWRGRGGFRAFLRDVGVRPAGHEIDRINPDGHYEPGNVRWVPAWQNQARARRTKDLRAELRTAKGPDGLKRTMTLREWAAHLGISWKTLLWRQQRNWGERLFSTACSR